MHATFSLLDKNLYFVPIFDIVAILIVC